MGTYRQAFWPSDESGYTSRQRWGGSYTYYQPTPLASLDRTLWPDAADAVSAAERALLVQDATAGHNLEGISRLLLRSEAVASSHIEGLSIGAGRLARAELQEREPGSVRYDRRAAAVLGNIRAMDVAVARAAASTGLTIETLCEVHSALLEHTDEAAWGGQVRTTQNWVGGSSYNPLGARYVPPPPEEVPSLLDDLVAFANRDDISPVVQAALCHSQFESIHPFADGNGRTGRALIQIVLMRAGVKRSQMPPVSLALATEREAYMDALAKMQSWVTPAEGFAAVNGWITLFSEAIIDAARDRARMELDLDEMRAKWMGRLGRKPRAGSSLALLLDEIQATPYFTVQTMVNATGRAFSSVNDAVAILVEAGIAEETTQGKRNRVFRVPDVIEEFEIVERRMASPARDTNLIPPVRSTPAGRPKKRGPHAPSSQSR